MKEKIITRTVITLKASVLGFDAEDNPVMADFDLPMMDEKKIIKYLSENAINFTPAKVRKVETVEQLYGMPESLFMKYATKLPPRKQYNNDTEEA